MSGDTHDEHVELQQLRTAMETRPVIDKSMGVLMAAYSLAEDDAWKTLVAVSQQTNTKLYTVAEEIVATTQEGVVDGRLRRQIEAAMKDLKTP
ncbi:ANTAR domain-containing protein [Streptomyces albidus (ex Kaewkla and Franco 2022)]|uniref:ANTAR domain-containing protein n=1 Tax=Streptomyces albidus (ex Kaewkla and Franco 2022) TaxID=722709 RepID=UPI0015EF21F5|nr:ANTAR domain-containing protein [Streptomyces albidus (ex Kaewkla and Franco 2022)]